MDLDQGNTILIVDDDEVNRESLRSILKEEYEILEACDGVEALQVLSEHETEIEGIVLDLIMPKMDGYGFLEVYSKEERWKDIPVLIATGDERSQTESRCLEMGAWDVVRKPFTPAVVYLRLKNNISRRQLHLLEKEKITNIFQRYVDPSILDELLNDDNTEKDLHGKTVEIAVLFVDIRNFTTMAEQLPPEDVVEILNAYLTVASRAVKQYAGTLDKFIGDCAMAFWGAPVPCEDKTYHACLAAMEMIRSARKVSKKIYERFGREVAFGVGIHVGPAVVGNIGAPDRMDYTAIGDTVNTASRLESNAPAGVVYISREVADRLGSRAETTSCGSSIKLKGKRDGFEVLRLDRLMGEDGEMIDAGE